MTEELRAKIDTYVRDTCIYYQSTHEDWLPNQFEKYLRSACIHFATEATKELKETYKKQRNKRIDELQKKNHDLEAQIEKMKCCENCAWWYKLPNGQRDCAETCENRNNWSLRR